MIKRILSPSKEKIFFLFCTRGTGKTTLLHQLFADEQCFYIDLLNLEYEERLALQPEILEGLLKENVLNKNILMRF